MTFVSILRDSRITTGFMKVSSYRTTTKTLLTYGAFVKSHAEINIL